ncbi:MAG TPA: hypothetical protein VIH28_04030 [Ignavibacteriaceae bacterium]
MLKDDGIKACKPLCIQDMVPHGVMQIIESIKARELFKLYPEIKKHTPKIRDFLLFSGLTNLVMPKMYYIKNLI